MRAVCRPVPPLAAAALVVLAGALALLARQAPARAAEPPTVIVVFDGSGSMWGKLDGERSSKLAMARDAVRQGLARLPPATRVGLMSFGHRRSGDCQDTEMILPPAPVDVEAVMAPLEKLNPRGRGPLTRALREAAGSLGPRSAPATVVLIHDGPDNCQQDPCTALGELRQAHSGVRVDVVALGLPPEEAQRMACLPQATGGRLHVASTADQANAALAAALQSDAPSPAAAAPAAPPGASTVAAPDPSGRQAAATFAVPAGRPGLQLSAHLVKGGPAVALPLHWQVRRSGASGPPLWEGTAPAPLLVLPSGRYDIEARSGLVTRQATAEAVEGEARSLAILLDAGTLVLATSPSSLAMLQHSVVALTRIETKGPGEPRLLRGGESEFALPAGNYLLALTDGTLRIERPVGIEAGSRLSLAGSLGLGVVELAAVAAKGGPRLDGVVYVVYEDDPDAPQGRREVARSAAADPRLKLPVGSYVVIARRGSAEARDRIVVREGETERRVLVLEAGQVSLNVRITGGQLGSEGPITHRLERLDVQPREVLHGSGTQSTFEVASGHWRLVTRIGLANVRAERDIRLKPGETEKVAIEHAAGAVRLRLAERAGGAPLPDVAWEVRDRAGQVVWVGLGTEARALLLAGRYTVKAGARGIAVEQPIEVRAGESRDLDLAAR
ncbi:MAG: VWA domain-containing protein [Hyphomicrobiaceae bacterium]|nr:VWA domain-containing protein [Hyphomicrobiaceae bacterium]